MKHFISAFRLSVKKTPQATRTEPADPRPFRDLSTCLNFEIVRYIKIPTTEDIESNDLNIENR